MIFRNQDLRHVDVAILYALGQKDRAQYIARRLRPPEIEGKAVFKQATSSGTNTVEYDYEGEYNFGRP